mmetsp:Transcript_1017/g.2367  ORF Transcript_1017/g.2367 Transcript_1017/m.2367 type:complete len:167 (+) Transcript_1017:41-541(+)
MPSASAAAPALLLLIFLSHAAAFLAPALPLLPSVPLGRTSAVARCRRPPALRAKNDIFERLGGDGALDTVVEDFYDRMLEDSEFESVLGEIDDVTLKDDPHNMMRVAFTGVPEDTKDIADLWIGLKAEHFDKVIGLMEETFDFISVEDDIAQEALKTAKGLKGLFK